MGIPILRRRRLYIETPPWLSYVDMLDILLGLIRAAREGNWNLHIQSVRAIIPWLFAYDRVNYARYLPYYYVSMTRLDIIRVCEKNFAKVDSLCNLEHQIPSQKFQQTRQLETINRHTQTSGGTKGLSLKPAAVSKYYLSAYFRSIALRELRRSVNEPKLQLIHEDLQHTRIIRHCRCGINNQHFGKWIGKCHVTRWWKFGLYIHRPPGTPSK